jgi:hypothetical protein
VVYGAVLIANNIELAAQVWQANLSAIDLANIEEVARPVPR